VKTRQRIRRVPFVAPAPFGVEVMSLARLWAMAPPGYLQSPQRPAFHLLIFCTAGATTHTVDFERYRLAPGRALWVRPGQVQRFSDNGGASAGELVLFQPDFLIPNTQAAVIANDRSGPVALEPPAPALAPLDRARRELRLQYAAARAAEQAAAAQSETLRHLLSVLILRLSLDISDVRRGSRNELSRRFLELLDRDFSIAHDVGHYARTLGYSTRTLARATQEAIGQTPKGAIQSRVSLEARRLLAHTNLPVSTIATQLGFRDPSNFATFFIQQTRQTPTTFRLEEQSTRRGARSFR
jgi:AraC-like DNA-binding protein